MLSLCLRQTEDSVTVAAFAINVSFSVAEFISAELEKSAEFIVFTAARRDVS